MESEPAKTTKETREGSVLAPGGSETSLRASGVRFSLWSLSAVQKATEELESWEGTAHVNRIAVRGVGIDCIQLCFRAYAAAGILPWMKVGVYSTEAGLFSRSENMERVLLDCLHAKSLPVDSPEFGDLVLFQTGDRSAHCGFYADGFVWHSLARQCVLRSPWRLWKRRAEKLIRVYGTGFRKDPKGSVRRYGR
jgi:cell wall-associated NlpC family hydrolase